MRDISEVMTGIYLDVFGENLSPQARKNLADTLQARDDVIPTRLKELGLLDEGVDVQGHGAYVPHYSVFDKMFSRLRGPVRLPAAGRNRKILSMNQRADRMTFGKGPNKLALYGTGELQVDPQSLLSAFRQRMRFVETKMLREQLFGMGAKIPVDDAGVPRIPEGWYIINGSGKSVPQRLRAWQSASPKERDELLASGEDFDSMLQTEGGTVKMLEEYRDSFLSKKGETKTSLDGWVADGTSIDDLRMLPQDVVETLVGKVFESQPGGFWASAFGMLSTAGRVATIFSHPMGYIQANVAANGILLMMTNPSRAPRAVMEFFGRGHSVRASNPQPLRRGDQPDRRRAGGRGDPHLLRQVADQDGERRADGLLGHLLVGRVPGQVRRPPLPLRLLDGARPQVRLRRRRWLGASCSTRPTRRS